jgi:hypothetical protein
VKDQLEVMEMFNQLQQMLAGKTFDSLRYHQKSQVLLLVAAGEQAKATNDFMKAVAEYTYKVQHSSDDKATAKQTVMKAFEGFLSKQKL